MDENFSLITYNSSGSSATRLEFIKYLLSLGTTFLLVQETWHIDSHVDKILNLNKDYQCYPVAGFDDSAEVLTGRPHGGLAIYYHQSLSNKVHSIPSQSRRIAAVSLKLSNIFNILVINVYLPNDNYSNNVCTEEFIDACNNLESIIQSSNCDGIMVCGDFNIDPKRNNAHYQYIHSLLLTHGLKCSWSHKNASPEQTFSLNGNSSMIDHIYLTDNLYDHILSQNVLSSPLNFSNHNPVVLKLTVSLDNIIPQTTARQFVSHPAWHKVKQKHICAYQAKLDNLLSKVHVPSALSCQDVHCKLGSHKDELDIFTNDILNCCLQAGTSFPQVKPYKTLAGWNEEIQPLRDKALLWHDIWIQAGKPHNGQLANIMRVTRLRYHHKVREVKRNESTLRNARLGECVAQSDDRNLWREVKKLDSKQITPSSIDGKSSPEEIVEIFAEKYKSILRIYRRFPTTNFQMLDIPT